MRLLHVASFFFFKEYMSKAFCLCGYIGKGVNIWFDGEHRSGLSIWTILRS